MVPILISKHCREHPATEDGTRVLVMRFWPRGVARDRFDAWLRELAPSVELLRWRQTEGSDPSSDADVYAVAWKERYVAEMVSQKSAIGDLRRRHEAGEAITLLCACHVPAKCHRSVLAELILRPTVRTAKRR